MDNDNDITAGLIIINYFFAHWIKEIDIKRYADDIPVLPLTNTINIHQYSDADDIPVLPLTNKINIHQYSDEILKHIPKDELKTIQNDLLYSKKKFVIPGNNFDRHAYITRTQLMLQIEQIKI